MQPTEFVVFLEAVPVQLASATTATIPGSAWDERLWATRPSVAGGRPDDRITEQLSCQ